MHNKKDKHIAIWTQALPAACKVSQRSLISVSNLHRRPCYGCCREQLLPAVCPCVKLLECRLARGIGHGHFCSPTLNDPTSLQTEGLVPATLVPYSTTTYIANDTDTCITYRHFMTLLTICTAIYS